MKPGITAFIMSRVIISAKALIWAPRNSEDLRIAEAISRISEILVIPVPAALH